MKEYIVDAIDCAKARCEQEDGSFVSLPLSLLPPEVQEGDCLTEEDGVFTIDTARTQRRRERMAARLNLRRLPPPS